jgi:glycosyltransferase involved in cell wall biosynthesis
MKSVGFDLSAIDPGFKSHAHRGIGRYVTELRTFFDGYRDAEISVGFFDHEALRRNGVADKVVSLVPCGRTSLRQHLVYPRRLHQGVMRDFSLLHYPAHMDAPAWSSKPYVLTVLDLIPHVLKDLYRAHKPSWRFMIARSLEVLAIRQATLLLAISETTADDLVRVLGIPRERIVVTPLGVDQRFFDIATIRSHVGGSPETSIRTKLGIPAGRPIVLYVGGHDERKNIGNLVGIVHHAAVELRARGKGAPLLVMAGRVTSRDEIERLESIVRRYGMERDVVSLGYVPDEDLKMLYAESSLFLFPTLYEGFGLPALEAMAAGLPVVASNTSSIPEVVGDAGRLFNPLSIDEGARAVVEVLESEDLRETLSRAGIARARTFTWERTGRATLEGYKRAYAALEARASSGRSSFVNSKSAKAEANGTFV